MKATFVIRFHSARHNNLLQTLRIMELWHEHILSESCLITVCQDNYCGEFPPSKWLQHSHFNLNLTEMQLSTITNFAISHATTERIVVLDDDRILPAGYFDEVLSELHPGVQITSRITHKLIKAYDDYDLINELYESISDHRSDELGCKNMWSGNTAFMKSDFVKCGGMDESYIGYGWEDSDMTLNMQRIGVKSIYKDAYRELHLWHEPLTYGKADQKKLFVDNGVRLCRKWNLPLPQMIREQMREYRTEIL